MGHLSKVGAGGGEELAGRIEDLVVAAEEAGVVVGDALAVLGAAGCGGELAVADEAVEQLRVVEDLVVSAEVGVLVAEGVEAV
ncbi:MAG: hypothetical protein E7B29_22495, partial [Mixta calida]|nr:hypothetical protein [Mixta calida]